MSNLGFKRHMGVKGTGKMYQTAAKGFTKIQTEEPLVCPQTGDLTWFEWRLQEIIGRVC